MPIPVEHNLLESSAELERLQRELRGAEQLLACFQQAMGHDMPNHLVAIQVVQQTAPGWEYRTGRNCCAVKYAGSGTPISS